MCSNISYHPPYENHPHEKNIYRILYIALVVYSIICLIGSITGAHINPAVTLSFVLDKKR
jgi:glycerol uptake facilitator-like aquaporin